MHQGGPGQEEEIVNAEELESEIELGPYEDLEFAPEDYFRRAAVADIFEGYAGAPLELDLGCGDGGFLMDLAGHHPDRQFLGVERLLGRVRKVCRKAKRRGLENVRVLRLDTAYAVKWLLPLGAFSRIHLLFPDPWPRKKHHKRRIVNPEVVKAVHALLAPGGEFLFKTDHAEYFEDASACILASGIFEAVPWPEDAFVYPLTDFEKLWLSEGKTINRLRLKPR